MWIFLLLKESLDLIIVRQNLKLYKKEDFFLYRDDESIYMTWSCQRRVWSFVSL